MKLKPTFKIPAKLFDAVYNLPAWQKALIMLASWAVPLGLFWFFFLAGSLGEIETISSRIPRLQKEIKNLETKKKQIPQLERDLQELKKILQQAVKLLPEKEDIPTVLTEISSLGNEAGLEIKSFTPGAERVEGFYASIPVSLSFNGPFHNTLVFFDKVGKMARIVHIKEVKMGNARETMNIWSQKGGGAKMEGAAASSGSTGNAGAETGGDSMERGSSWVINTTCRAVTYRFLTPEEQKAGNKNKNKKRRRR